MDKRLPIEVKIVFAVGFAVLVVFAVYAWRTTHPFNHDLPAPRHDAARRGEVTVLGGRIKFHDVAAQSRQFINYYNTIHLTPEQEAVKAAALKSRPAACCMHSDAYTCCCTCNLSKTVWGLTNYAIATYHINPDQVQEVVDGWLSFVNPGGYDGGACYRGECSRTGHEKGCGGMTENQVNL
jgi:hypothetical protein